MYDMTLTRVDEPDWTAGGAACLNNWQLHAPAETHPERETPTAHRERVAAALAVCSTCPMLDECRAWTFLNWPTGTISGGLDLTRQEPAHMPDDQAIDTGIYLARISDVCEDADIVLTDYQRHYIDETIYGNAPRWQHGGSRPLALRAQCEWLLDHPRVGFRRQAQAATA